MKPNTWGCILTTLCLFGLKGAPANKGQGSMPPEEVAVEQCLLSEMFSSTKTFSFDCTKIPHLIPSSAQWRGTDSKLRQREYYRILNRAEWASLWRRHRSTTEPPPSVNFAQDMVVSIFRQGTQADAPIFAKVVDHQDALVVYFTGWAAQPDQGASLEAAGPYGIYVLPRTTKKLILKERHESMTFPAGFGTVREFP
jgi:hypothetical protein